MNSTRKIQQERICGALLHFLILAALFTVFAHAARPQDPSRIASRLQQSDASQRANQSALRR